MKAIACALTFAALLSTLPAFADEDYSSIRIEPERPTPLDPIHITVTLGSEGDPNLRFVGVQGRTIRFQYAGEDFVGIPPPFEVWTAEATLEPLPAGVYTIDVSEISYPGFARTFEVVEPRPELRLRDTGSSSFIVSVQLEPPLSGPGYGVPLTDESGYFWFFDPDNIEITVKILDGRAVNGKYWVFLSSMTDVGFTVHVQQCPDHPEPAPCAGKVYQSVPGVNRNVIDVNFPGL